MVTIKINNDKVNIPTFSELTVKQYRELLPYIADSGGLDLLRYISITTGIDYKKSLHYKIAGLNRAQQMLGTFKFLKGDAEPVKDISYIENVKPNLILKVEDKYYDLRQLKLKAIGYRILFEEFLKTKPSVIDCYIFMTASVIEKDFDYDSTIWLKEEFENYNAYKILSIGAFFLAKLKRKERHVSLILRLLLKALLTNTRLKNHKLVLTDWRSIN